MTTREKYIAHVDMDAFFASVEQRDNPSYKNKPVIVGADPKDGKGRGVVSACSYEARKYGIHSAMPISIAYKMFPGAIFLPVNMEKYFCISQKIFTLLERFTPEVEPVSIDEAFLDITGSYHLFGSAVDTCRKIKALIKKETALTASVGLAPNKMTAKIASDAGKPNGFIVVNEENLLKFLHPLPVKKLWTIGGKTNEILKKMDIRTIGELAKQDASKLEDIFGKNGRHIWELANGIDLRGVETDHTVKSVSNEYTFNQNTHEKHKILDILMMLSEKVSWRLRKAAFKGRTITLKIRFNDFSTFTRAITLKNPTNFVDVIYKNARSKLERFNLGEKTVRLVGIKVSNLTDQSWPETLFDENSDETRKKERIHTARDHVLDKFGEDALKYRFPPPRE